MKIGDRVHVFLKKYEKLITEWDGVIVTDEKHFGDGKRPLWGVARIKALKDWDKQGCVVMDEGDLKLIESTK